MNFFADKHLRTFTITWDNVGKSVGPKHQVDSASGAKTYKSWANAIAVFNRIPAPNPIHDDWLETIPAQDIPVQTLLPTFKDWADLQKRMVALISRTLARNIAYLTPLTKKYVEQHVEHEYSLESKMRSEIVSINLTYKWTVFNEGLFS